VRLAEAFFEELSKKYSWRLVRHATAIPACPVPPKSGHSANARVYESRP